MAQDELYARIDEDDDPLFYSAPRKLVHIDDHAIAAVRRLYAEALPRSGLLLDLMASWRSHLPPQLDGAGVVGLGLNAEEMGDNPQLVAAVVHDINRNPALPFASQTFDGVMCAVSVQYLIHPVEVWQEVHRVSRPGAPFVIAFSNRCFPTKAVALWRMTSDRQHVAIVAGYFQKAGGWRDLRVEDRRPERPVAGGDPLYAVWARKAEV